MNIFLYYWRMLSVLSDQAYRESYWDMVAMNDRWRQMMEHLCNSHQK